MNDKVGFPNVEKNPAWKRFLTGRQYKSIDWEDLGVMSGTDIMIGNRTGRRYKGCDMCGDRVFVGKDKGGIFNYCRRCMVKINIAK